MNNILKKNIQDRVLSLLTSVKKRPLYILAEDCCSEMSRLVGYWILNKNREAEAIIIKRDLVNKKQHDILVIKEDDSFIVIDPTIWQFYKNKRTIFLGNFKTIEKVFEFARDFYGGDWSVSEKLNFADSKKKQKTCVSIIIKNLKSLS